MASLFIPFAEQRTPRFPGFVSNTTAQEVYYHLRIRCILLLIYCLINLFSHGTFISICRVPTQKCMFTSSYQYKIDPHQNLTHRPHNSPDICSEGKHQESQCCHRQFNSSDPSEQTMCVSIHKSEKVEYSKGQSSISRGRTHPQY